MIDSKAINRLGMRANLAAEILSTAVAGVRRRPVTLGEWVDGKPEAVLDTSQVEAILAELDAAIAADETAFFLRDDDELIALSDLATMVREALASAAPFRKARAP